MGKMKTWAMDNEDRWFDIAGSKIGSCETIAEFMIQMEHCRDMMAHYTDAELDELQCDIWDNFWTDKR